MTHRALPGFRLSLGVTLLWVSLVVLVPLAVPMWPHAPVPASAWIAVVLLGAICTAVAYLLYFGLIRNAGAQYAASVTFLIPIFGVVWGAIFLHETITVQTIVGCANILLGTALATGKIKGLTTGVVRGSRQ